MMKTVLVLFTLLLTSFAAAQVGAKADQIVLVTKGGSKVLTGCKVMKVEPDGVRVFHDSGMAMVPWECMPPAWQAAIPNDPEVQKRVRMEREAAAREAYAKGEADRAALIAKETEAAAAAAKAATPATRAAAAAAAPKVLLRGEVLPLRDQSASTPYEGRTVMRVFPSGTFVCLLGYPPADKNGRSVSVWATPTGETAHYKGGSLPLYKLEAGN